MNSCPLRDQQPASDVKPRPSLAIDCGNKTLSLLPGFLVLPQLIDRCLEQSQPLNYDGAIANICRQVSFKASTSPPCRAFPISQKVRTWGCQCCPCHIEIFFCQTLYGFQPLTHLIDLLYQEGRSSFRSNGSRYSLPTLSMCRELGTAIS